MLDNTIVFYFICLYKENLINLLKNLIIMLAKVRKKFNEICF